VITRNSLIGLIVLLAGLATGCIVSFGVTRYQSRLLQEYLSPVTEAATEGVSFTRLGMEYNQSKAQFQDVLNQFSEAVREASYREHLLLRSQDTMAAAGVETDRLRVQAERALELLRLEDYYIQFFMHYFRWLDTGDAKSSVQYRLAMGQLHASLDHLGKKYNNDPLFTPKWEEEVGRVLSLTEQTDRTIRWARVTVVVLIFTLIMGIPRFIRDSGHKKFAGSLFFDSLFRPNRVSGLSRWHSLRRMAPLLTLLYLFGLFIFTSFSSWVIPLVFGALGLIPVITLTGLSGNRSRWPEMMISFIAPRMPLVILVLGVVAIRGSYFFWYRIWTNEHFRLVVTGLLAMFLFRKIHLNLILARKWSRRSRTFSAVMVLVALGLQLLAAGTPLFLFGTGRSLAFLNSELMILPGDFFPAVPEHNPWLIIAGVILASGSLISFFYMKRMDPELPVSR
jgi:hypothetical protein